MRFSTEEIVIPEDKEEKAYIRIKEYGNSKFILQEAVLHKNLPRCQTGMSQRAMATLLKKRGGWFELSNLHGKTKREIRLRKRQEIKRWSKDMEALSWRQGMPTTK